MKYLITILALLIINPTWAKTIRPKTSYGVEYPRYAMLINDKEHGRIQVRCNEIKDTGNISCTFDQVVISHMKTKQLDEQLVNIENQTDNKIKEELSALCAQLNKDHGLQKRLSDQHASSTSEDVRNLILSFKNLCENPSKSKAILLKKQQISKEKSTCKIFNKTYDQEFKYDIPTKKWVYQEGPDSDWTNDCGMIHIAYLEKDSREGYGDWAWNYTSRKIVTNKSGHILLGQCSELTKGKDSVENEVSYYAAYAYRVEPTQFMNCKFINFSD